MIELYVSFFVLGYKYFAKLAHFPQTTKFLLQIINSMIQKFLLLYIIYCNFAPVICLFRLNIVSSFGMNRGLTRVTPLFRSGIYKTSAFCLPPYAWRYRQPIIIMDNL